MRGRQGLVVSFKGIFARIFKKNSFLFAGGLLVIIVFMMVVLWVVAILKTGGVPQRCLIARVA